VADVTAGDGSDEKRDQRHRMASDGEPGAPATAKPSNTTLPVMLAVKTRPRPRKLTASITPVKPVRVKSASARRSLLVTDVYPKPKRLTAS